MMISTVEVKPVGSSSDAVGIPRPGDQCTGAPFGAVYFVNCAASRCVIVAFTLTPCANTSNTPASGNSGNSVPQQ
jgi:hypothetical protein